jgi:exosortase
MSLMGNAQGEAAAAVGADAPARDVGAWARVAWLAPLLSLLLSALYGQTLANLGRQWWDDANYTHGFLVPLFSGYLVWRQRARLGALVPRGSALGLPVLLAGLGALLLGDLAAELFLSRASLIVVLAGLVLFHLGTAVFRVLLFPLAFLLFMVPLPAILFYAITFPLQSLAAEQAAWALDVLGVPVILDGNVIHLSQLTLGVTEACSGIRSLISLLGGAVAWAYLALPAGWMMMLFVASTVPITILANAGRVISTGLIGQWFGVEYASGFFHTFSGWAVFVFAFICLFAVHGGLRWARGRLARRRA